MEQTEFHNAHACICEPARFSQQTLHSVWCVQVYSVSLCRERASCLSMADPPDPEEGAVPGSTSRVPFQPAGPASCRTASGAAVAARSTHITTDGTTHQRGIARAGALEALTNMTLGFTIMTLS